MFYTHYYTNEEAKKKFSEFWEKFFNKDVSDFGKEFKEFGKEFAREMRNFGRDFKENMSKAFTENNPLVNVVETASGFRIEVAAPGLNKESFKITLKDNLLSISADIETTILEGETYKKREFDFGKFKRHYELPDTADEEKIEAKYENGILFIHIAKKEGKSQEDEREINIA